ncbi:MAG: alginate export family protein, partial [Tepidisphaeraceae bacterium]
FDYNSYYIGIGSTGPIGDRITYGVEAAYEGGDTLSNSFVVGGPFLSPIAQTRDDISAWAADARIDYLFPDERRSRLSGEVIIASGDSDRLNTSNTFGGNAPNTKDKAFNAFGLLNTGLAFAPAVSNLIAFRVGGSTFPLPDTGALRRFQIGTDVFLYNKFDADAPIDELTSGQSFLGWEPDFYLNWQMTSDVTLVVRYGIFFPSDAFPSEDSRQYIYGGVTYAF